MGGKPAFNPNEPFEVVDEKPPFDPNQPFEAVSAGEGEKPAFDPKQPFEVVNEGTPLPRERPKEAPGGIQATQEMPPVQPTGGESIPLGGLDPETPVTSEEDTPYRSRLSGTQREMLTPKESYAQRDEMISGAKQGIVDATAKLAQAQERQRKQRETPEGNYLNEQQRQGQQRAIDAAVPRAEQELADAKSALEQANRSPFPTETPTRSAVQAGAQGLTTTVVGGAAGLVRPVDMALKGLTSVGKSNGIDTGVSDYLSSKSQELGGMFQPDPAQANRFTTKLGSGVGSAAGFMLGGGPATKLTGLSAGKVMGGLGAAQQGEEYYQEANKTPEYGKEESSGLKKLGSYLVGAAIGSTEGFGGVAKSIDRLYATQAVHSVVSRMDKLTGGRLGAYVEEIGKASKEEGVQEWFQQIADNVAKQQLFGTDPKSIDDGAMDNAIVGAAVGAGMAGLFHAPHLVVGGGRHVKVDGVPVPNQEVVTPDQIAQQIAAGNIPGVTPTPTAGAPSGTQPPVVGAEAVPGQAAPATFTTPSGQVIDVPPAPMAQAAEKPVIPTNEPITTVEDGIKTTRVLHGVEDSYAVDRSGGKDALLPHEPGVVDTPTLPTQGEETVREYEKEAQSVPVQGLYSRLRSWVQEKGPLNATSARWISLLKRGDFTKEEMNDLQLPGFIGSGYGRVAKDDVLNYVDSMTAPLMEVTRTPLNEAEKAEILLGIRGRIAQVMNADPTARVANPRDPGQISYNPEHSTISALLDQYVNIEQDRRWARFEQYTTPGPRESYTELTMHVPARDRSPALGLRLGARVTEGGDFYGQHYDTPNEIVTMRVTVRTSVDGTRVAVLEEMQRDATTMEKQGSDVNLPFKESWAQLGFTRFLMWAANQGIRTVAIVDAKEQMRRYPQGTADAIVKREKGMQEFYNRKVVAMAKKWSKKLGGTMTYVSVPGNVYEVRPMDGMWGVFPEGAPLSAMPIMTSMDPVYAEEYAQSNTVHTRFQAMVLPDSAIKTIELGLPSYIHAKEIPGGVDLSMEHSKDPLDKGVITPLVDALESLIKQLDLKIPLTILAHTGNIRYKVPDPKNPGKTKTETRPNTMGLARIWGQEGKYASKAEIHVSINAHESAAEVWATLVHELGHVIMATIYRNAPAHVRTAVDAAHAEWLTHIHPNMTMKELIQHQSNAVSAVIRGVGPSAQTVGDLSTKDDKYWKSFDEFFAEQVAKWATSRAKPLTLVDKFFKGLGKTIVDMLAKASQMFGFKYEVNKALGDFLDSYIKSEPNIGMPTAVQTTQQTTTANADQMGEEETAVPGQVETIPVADVVNGAFNGRPPKEVQEALAYADKFNWIYKWGIAIQQLAQKNLHIKWLQQYTETVSIAQLTKQQIMIRAQEVLKLWNKLGGKQADAVSLLIDDIQNMNYLTPDEVTNKVTRHPTQAELTTLAQQHGVTQAGLSVFGQIAQTFQEFLTRYEAVLRNEAMKIGDETRRDLKLAAITKQIAAYRSRPYFPAMRFGNYTLTIRNAANKVIHFETFETKRQRAAASRAVRSQMAADDFLQLGFLNREARPLLGVPTGLLDLMTEKMTLSKTQRDALDQLKFELSPAQSFKHRFQHKTRVEGYSMDFRRAYANYFFHGANHLMKVMYADRLRALIKMTRAEVAQAPEITKREKIEQYMQNHIESWLDPKSDWAQLSGIGFSLQLAFVPAAATQNLTQTLITSYPFLAHHFNDVKAIAALMAAGRRFENFYRKGTLGKSAVFEQKALFQGMTDGVISETQAAQIAGIAEGNTLGLGFGGSAIQRHLVKFNEMGAFLFEMAEQVNRRLIFRAALDLALKNPDNKYVKSVVEKRSLLYKQRRDEGWTEAEATAYVVAVDATHQTQFQYGKEFSPRFLKGKARAFLMFKMFMQSYLVFLSNYPTAIVRPLLVLAFLGGFMGLPGADELKDILQIIGYRLFGKDFRLEQEARKLILELVGKEHSDTASDLLLHGLARKGFGIPAIMDMLGGTVGVDIPMPTFDRSRSISMGTILPIELAKIFGPPTQSSEKVIAEQTQKAVGPVFGVGFSAYKALANSQYEWNDFKRYEQMMPRALGNVSKAYRAWTEGGSRTSTGSQIVKYDVRDPEQMFEVLGMAAGYQPYRQSIEWERALAKNDGVKFLEIRRDGLMKEFGNAVLGKDRAEIGKVKGAIQNYNRDLPSSEKSMAITSETLEKSVQTKAQSRAMQERGLSTKKSEIPIMRQVDKLYPDSQRELRKVPKGLTP